MKEEEGGGEEHRRGHCVSLMYTEWLVEWLRKLGAILPRCGGCAGDELNEASRFTGRTIYPPELS